MQSRYLPLIVWPFGIAGAIFGATMYLYGTKHGGTGCIIVDPVFLVSLLAGMGMHYLWIRRRNV